MARRHLRELLREEQEPFALKSYIDERRRLLRRPPPTPCSKRAIPQPGPPPDSPPLLLNTPSSHSQSHARRSPLFDLAAAKNPSAAYLLLSLRHQQQQQQQKKRGGSIGLHFFSAVFKFKKWAADYQQRCEIGDGIMVKNMLRMSYEADNGRLSCHKALLSSNQFHKNRRPETESGSLAASPSASPHTHNVGKQRQQLVGGTRDDVVKAEKTEYDEEQEKQQFSPVSVLDPTFHEPEEEEEEDHQVGHVEPYHQRLPLVQRAKHQVMSQIRRFERLAGLDPIELDKLLAHRQVDDDDDLHFNGSTDDGFITDKKMMTDLRDLDTAEINKLIRETIWQSRDCRCAPKTNMRRLVAEIVKEESRETTGNSGAEELVKRVHQRFEAWNDVSSNTIDMMVDMEFRVEGKRWKTCGEEVQGLATFIEFAIYELLVCELFDELLVGTARSF